MGFKLKSKLSATKYPCLQTMEEILQWLVFAKSVDPYAIDPVFLGRLGAMAKDEKRKHIIISGHRSTQLQEKLYLNAGGVKNPDGTYSDPHGKVNGKVAKPNRSFHEYKLAVDSGDKYYKSIDKLESTYNQKKLNKYGLFKPLTIGNGIKESSSEDWHIQPLETWNADLEKRKELMPTEIVNQQSPLQVLKSKCIISDIDYWDKSLKTQKYVQSQNIKALITNFYRYLSGTDDFIEAINYLNSKKVITNKNYWLDVCARSQDVESEYVKLIVERMVNLIK